ncbi:MAG: carbohydrate kinase family protein [Oscillospiraceae bacterium]
MKYLVTGTTIIDNLIYVDGSTVDRIMGGCAIYSLSGIRMFDDDVVCLSGVGNDFDSYYGEWLDRNHITHEGFLVRDEHTNQTHLKYAPDGSYTCKSIYGGSTSGVHNPALWLKMDDLRPWLPKIKGLYMFYDINDIYGDAYRLKDKYGYRIMWEYPNWNDTSYIPVFEETIKYCDYYSLNFNEASALFGVKTMSDAEQKIRSYGIPCYFRLGTKGACMITKDETWFVPMINLSGTNEGVDPTGCGNSSTAACFWGLNEGYDPLMSAILGNVMAGFSALQYGPYPDLGPETRAKAWEIAKTYYDKYKKS